MRNKRSLITSTILFTLISTQAYSATRTWTGITSNLWNINTNWDLNTLPVNGDNLIFPTGASNQSTNNNLGITSVGNYTFQNTGSGVAAYSQTGPGYTINGTYSADANLGTQTIFSPPQLPNNASVPFIIGSGTRLRMFNFITGAGTATVALSGSGTMEVDSLATVVPGYTLSGTGTTLEVWGFVFQTATLPVTLGSGTILNLDATNGTAAPSTAPIGGSGVVNVINSGANGTFVLSGANTYSGLTTINSGNTLQGNAVNTFSANSQHNALGTLSLNNNNNAIGSLTGNGAVSLGTGILTTGGDGSSTTFSGNITGTSGGLTKAGAGTFIISGNNAYTGATAVSTGILQAGSTTALANSSDFTVNATLDLNSNSSTIGSLAGSGTVTLGTATLTMGGSGASTTFSGSISGSGGIIKTGGGTQIFSSANSYTGTTTLNNIASNILRAGASNVFAPSSAHSVGASATLDLNNFSQTIGSLAGAGTVTLGSGTLTAGGDNTSTSFSGAMSGTGGLTKQGTGTLSVGGTGTKTYSGTTTVSAGILQATAANAFSANSTHALTGSLDLNNFSQTIASVSGSGNITLGSGTLTTGGDNSSTTHSGNISGTGALIKTGSGNFTITGTNSYSGGTTVSAGRLTGNTNSLQNAITNNSDLTFDQTFTGTYSGAITGTGNLTKQGTGTVVFTGNSNYSGQTVINEGTLTVNGIIAGALQLSVNLGATLKGTGSLAAASGSISGTVQPGNSVGTLTLVGTQSFNAGSTLAIEVSPPAASLLLVNSGDVSIASPATLALTVDVGTYTSGSVYPILRTPSGTVTGTFSTVTTNMPLIAFNVVYLANEIDLVLAFVPFSNLVNTGDEAQVAACLDRLAATASGDLSSIINILRMASNATSLRNALNQFLPSVFTDLALAQQNNTFRVRSSISNRLEQIYQKACGLNVRHSNLWVDGFGDWVYEGKHGNTIGFHASTGGAMLGYDYSFANHFVVGLNAAYTYSDLHFNHDRGTSHINSYYGTLYTGTFYKYFFANLMAMAGYNDYATRRDIDFVTNTSDSEHCSANRLAKARPQGYEIAGHADLGLLFDFDHIGISPFVMADYIFLHNDAFKERGAQSLNLHVSKANSNMFRGEAGLQGTYCIVREHSKWRPYAKISYVREERFSGKHRTADLDGTGCRFKSSGLYPDRNIVSPGLGLTAYFLDDRCYFSLNYAGEFGDKYRDNKADAQFSVSF